MTQKLSEAEPRPKYFFGFGETFRLWILNHLGVWILNPNLKHEYVVFHITEPFGHSTYECIIENAWFKKSKSDKPFELKIVINDYWWIIFVQIKLEAVMAGIVVAVWDKGLLWANGSRLDW